MEEEKPLRGLLQEKSQELIVIRMGRQKLNRRVNFEIYLGGGGVGPANTAHRVKQFSIKDKEDQG